MPITYIDTSAFLKLLVQEPNSDDVRAAVAAVELWSSTLLGVEAHRASLRLGIKAEEVDNALAAVTLVVPSETTFMTARSVGTAELRTLDALHLAAALELGDDLGSLLTFVAHLAVMSPGLDPRWWNV